MTEVSAGEVTCAEKLRILANETRLQMVEQLLGGPRRVGELASRLDVDQPLISYHLRVMREAGLVVATREGQSMVYELAPDVGGSGRHVDLGCCRLSFSEGCC